MKKLRNAATGGILLLLLATVVEVGFTGCSPAEVRPDEKHAVVESRIIECKPNGDYNIPELKYNTEAPETTYLRMSGEMERPTGIQFRDLNSGEIKKIFFGGRAYQKYACQLLGKLK